MELGPETETRAKKRRKSTGPGPDEVLLKKCSNSTSTLLKTTFYLSVITLIWDSGGLIGPVSVSANHEIESCVLQTHSTLPPLTSAPPQQHQQSPNHHHLVNSHHPVHVSPSQAQAQSESSSSAGKHTAVSKIETPIAVCHIRTLTPDVDVENLTSSLPIPTITKLKLICNDVLFFESVLGPDQLSKLSDLQELWIEKCKLKYLPAGSFSGLRHLKRLTIKTGNSDWAARSLDISTGTFTGPGSVSGLKHLNLGFNHMWNLPEKLLCQLSSLQTLNLTHNLLSDMLDLGLPKYVTLSIFDTQERSSSSSSGSSACLSELKSLDVSYNNLQGLGGRRFETMRRLGELRIQHNVLENLQDDSFYGLSNLKLLNLSSNKLSSLSSKLFGPCKVLRELDLRNNSIKALSPGLLSSLEHLQILDLSSNLLTSQWISSQETFKGLLRLIILNLSNNQISHLSASTFFDLHQVQNLNLENNRISSIEDSTFSHLNNLHSLNLARNQLVKISSSMLNGLFILSKLSLDHNSISGIEPGSFRNCTSLQDLGLVGNQFSSVPEALQGLALLKTLDIGENLIGSLSNDSFTGLGQLYGLRLVGNRLSTLPRNLCDPLKRLRVLNLAQNRISKIGSNTFVGCPELRVLLLNTNSLEEIPNSLSSQLSSLLWLNVSENHIRIVNYQLLPASLEWIDLSHNRLEALNGAATGSVATNGSSQLAQHHLRLRVVDASHNQLTTLDHHSIPSSLEILSLGHNKIAKIGPDTFSRAGHLRRVELFGNQLENLLLSALRLPLSSSPSGPASDENGHKPSQVEFFLGGNPFLCDCELEWLTKINQAHIGGGPRQYPIVVDLDSIICRLTYSRSESRIPLPAMRPSDFLCKYESICFSTCHCCGFTCDCEMTCSSNCSCYHDDNWSANVVDCSSSRHLAVPSNLPMDSTDVYLDGNIIPSLKQHTFIGRKNLKVLFLNGSRLEFIANKSFNGLMSLRILHLENNRLRQLFGYEFEQLTTLNELYLQNNQLEYISNTTFLPLKSLEILRLDGNHLVTFTVWQLSLNPYLVDIGIARNRWNCGDCVFLHQFYGWVTDNSKKIMDLVQIRCVWNTSLEQGPHLMDYNNTCGSSWTKMLLPSAFEDFDLGTAYPFIILISVILIICTTATFAILCRDNVRVWIYATFGLRICTGSSRYRNHDDGTDCVGDCGDDVNCNHHNNASDKAYDSYFIYSEKDEEFITSRISDELESAVDNYRLCLQNRDLICETGGDLKHVMTAAVDNSKSVVIFLSRNFFQADWTSSEYRSALYSVLKSATATPPGRSRRAKNNIIIVFIESIPEPEMSSDLRSWLRNNKIHRQLHYGAKRFWQTFKYLLPDPSSHYQSNITSHTTSSSASSGGASVVAPPSALKYCEVVPNNASSDPNSGPGEPNKLWPFAQSFVALPPPKYGTTIGGGQKPNCPPIINLSPSHHLPILGTQQLLNCHNSPSSQEPSSTSSSSSSSTTHKSNSCSSGQGTRVNKAGPGGSCSEPTTNDDPTSIPIPSFLFQPNASSPVPMAHFRGSHHTNNNNPGLVDSYNDGEHVYSTLDPPSPQHRSTNNAQAGPGPLQLFPKQNHHPHHQQQHQQQHMMNNIHLPNGYTYSPSPQQWHPPQPQPPQQHPPLYSGRQPPTTTNSQATTHKMGLGGIMTTMSVPGHNGLGSRQKDSVQTYLV